LASPELEKFLSTAVAGMTVKVQCLREEQERQLRCFRNTLERHKDSQQMMVDEFRQAKDECLAEVKELSRIAVDENRDRAFDATKHFMESAAIQCKAGELDTTGMGTGKGREYFQGEYEKQMKEELMVKLADAAVQGLARDFDEVKARLRDEVIRMVGEEVHLSYANQWRDEMFERLKADVTMKMVREEVGNAMDQNLEEASDKMQRRFEAAVDGLKVDMCDRASVAGMVEESRQEWSEASTERFDEVSRALADVHDRLQGHAQQLRGEIASSQAKVLGVLAETGDELARRIELQSSSSLPPQVGGDTQSQLSEDINQVQISVDGAELRVAAAERKLSVLEEKLIDAENCKGSSWASSRMLPPYLKERRAVGGATILDALDRRCHLWAEVETFDRRSACLGSNYLNRIFGVTGEVLPLFCCCSSALTSTISNVAEELDAATAANT
ncbi:hypothetical protein FOZ62_024174, partial [Perkinsus olseni]